MAEFAHLHLHTEYSLLDGMGRIEEYVARAKEVGIHHMAVTDHGVMYAAMDWYKAATKAGLHPIIGMEAYLAEGRATERERKSYHLLLLAENDTGYRNLLKLASWASLKGYYYRPRIDLEWLQECHEGLIATSACLGGPVANNFLHGQPEKAVEYAGTLAEIFGPDRFYIEIQDHGLKEQRDTNRDLIELARRLNLPLVATNDVHYCSAEDAPYQDLLVCIQTNTTVKDPKRLKSESNQLYFKSPEEMAQVFGEIPEALSNTIRIAEMCTLDLGFKGYHLPHFEVPEGFTPESYLEHLCREGVKQRYGHDDGEVGARLNYELEVIRNMGFTNYFLVVWDFVKFAKDNGILVGPGRGSAAGSIVTYALGITALDPLKYGLIFERFLNPSRITMPDIDIDFADDRRGEVIDYVVRKYGDDRVAQIATFGTMAAKASVRDVGRAMGLSFAETDRVAKLIPAGPGVTIDSALEKVPELRKLYESDPTVRELIDSAKRVEGIARHSSTHAAGVVISRDPLVEHVPLQRAGGKSEGEVTTQYPMTRLEEIGLLKMDFLGLSTLTILGKAVELARRKKPDLTLENIPLDDPKAYELLRRGETVGIFQLEGGMTTRMTIDVAPTCFEDLIALMALIRPGPMEMAPDYIARKHGRTPIEYMHPDLEPILKETYGIALYQEQIMQIANVLAGFSMAEGDGLRKAMGKKLPEEMAKYRGRFIEGCTARGVSKELAGEIWDMIERFAGYGFNKAHSAAYAVIAAQTAYLKANFPVEFMAAILSTEIGNSDKIVVNVLECRRAGIEVLPPDINLSDLEFTVEVTPEGKEAVRFGLAAVKNVGHGAVRAILDARAKQPGGRFPDLETFCEAIDWSAVSKRAVECLAKCGALDCFGQPPSPRAWVLSALEPAIAAGQQRQKAVARGQMGLFDFGGAVAVAAPPRLVVDVKEIPRKQLLAWEKELVGLYLSDHPLTEILEGGMEGIAPIVSISERPSGEKVKVVAMITGVRRVPTKTNRTMAIMELEDLTGTIELVAFPDCYEQYAELWEEDQILEIVAKVDRRGEQVQLICETATTELTVGKRRPRKRRVVHLQLPTAPDVEQERRLMHDLYELLLHYEGDDEVVLHVPTSKGPVKLRSRSRRVEWSNELAAALTQVLGPERFEVREELLAS
ncbi:MAG TPA: DNA polymerase III subunit alpha [Thermomicrobiales bacterium]